MKRRHLLIVGAPTVALAGTALAGNAEACWGCAPSPAATDPAVQAKAVEIRKQYDERFNTLGARLRTTSRDLDAALAQGDTARADELRQKLYDLEKEHAALRAEAWAELEQAGAAGTWMPGAWACRWHDGHRGMGRGYAMQGRMGPQGPSGPGCRW